MKIKFLHFLLNKICCIRKFDSEFYECPTYHLMILDRIQVMKSFDKAINYKLDVKIFTKNKNNDFYINSEIIDLFVI